MNYYRAIGAFDARIDGFDSAKVIGEISKMPAVISLTNEGETVFVSLPFMYRKRLESICDSCGSLVTIERERGIIYFISKYIRRFGIFAGILFCIAVSLFLSNIVLEIRVVGANSEAVESSIKEILAQEGIKAGGYIPSINFLDAQTGLFEMSPDVSWASIGHSGSVVTVNISMPSNKVKSEEGRIPCNIVASHDGRIVSADVLVGEFTSLIGNGVKKGDILVSGIVDNPNGSAYYRHSIAKVIAEYEETVTFDQKLYDRVETDGETVYKKRLCFFEYEIPLPGFKHPSENSRISSDYTPIMIFGLKLPIGIRTDGYTEIITKNKIFSTESAQAELIRKLDIYEKNLIADKEIIQKDVSVDVIDDTVRLTAKYLLRGDIASESPIFVDDKTKP